MIEYKFVELSSVTDEQIEAIVNEWVRKGWRLDAIHFAMREASHRPAMAFIRFVRDVPDPGGSAPPAAD
ncbi:MAG: DUF4177 domain-containing protein [Deltaproteobacteria bacterium]|nr:MAG: DUF4177 domain-containing protein [Deltaproteobacteria bacterium]